MFNKKVILLILDGWGIGKKDKFNAIDNAKTPNYDKLVREFPNIQLRADGPYVGLPEGQFGTSEINHQVIGAGRVFMQDLPRINKEIQAGTFFNNKVLLEAAEHVRSNKSSMHLVGIVSDGNVHASLNHLLNLIEFARRSKVENLYVHVFTDGRDTPPKSASAYLKAVADELKTGFKHASISTVQGRFYLDRDRDWDKTEKAIQLILNGKGRKVTNYEDVINFSYNQNTTDEFFDQFILDETGVVKPDDAVIFFHYRTDRMHQLVKRFLDEKIKNIYSATFISISEEFKTNIVFPRLSVDQTLAWTIANAGMKQYHLTETEKYTHLTYFFNSGREEKYNHEEWELVQSNRYVKPYYNFEPSMRAFDITKNLVKAIEEDKYDFLVVNYPNTDMVGHTGNYEAAVIAAESVDMCLGRVFEAIKGKLDKYSLMITADHGNSDEMWDYENNQPHTQHTLNPVPLIMVSDIKCRLDKRESLEDIAPTILDLMSLDKPEVMTGSSLVVKK